MCKVKTKVAGEAAVDAQPAGLTPLTSAFLSCFHTYIDERETSHSVYEVGNVRHHSECAIRKRWISIFHKQPKPVLWAINQAAFSVISVLLLGSDSALVRLWSEQRCITSFLISVYCWLSLFSWVLSSWKAPEPGKCMRTVSRHDISCDITQLCDNCMLKRVFKTLILIFAAFFSPVLICLKT